MKQQDFEHRLIEERKNLEYFSFSLTKDKEEAEDLVQDTLLKALTHRDSFDESTNIKAWLFTIMKNTFINNYRRKKRSEELYRQTDSQALSGTYTTIITEIADHEARYKDILKEIAVLPKEQRIPFNMINQGYKYQEIANMFNISIGTVKSRIFLARKKLMKNLDNDL